MQRLLHHGPVHGAIGSDHDDTLIGFNHSGSNPNDVFSNEFYGGKGNDFIDGRGGDDTLSGGEGDDSILGGAGSDLIHGDAGDDVIDASGPNDQAIDHGLDAPGSIFDIAPDANPDDDKDVVYGGGGNDSITTGDDADSVYGGSGNDMIDSGIDATHPSLAGCIDVDGGRDFSVDGDGNVVVTEGPHDDVFGHGTACAGIIHALAPEAVITSVRVLGPGLRGKAAAFHAGLQWAVDEEFDVINLSLGAGKRDWALAFHEVCDRAYFGNSFVVTAANNTERTSFPSLYASVTSVACNTGTEKPSTANAITARSVRLPALYAAIVPMAGSRQIAITKMRFLIGPSSRASWRASRSATASPAPTDTGRAT